MYRVPKRFGRIVHDTLFVNITNADIDVSDDVYFPGYGFAVILSNGILYIGVYDKSFAYYSFQDKQLGGPYDSMSELIGKHLFGMYDGLRDTLEGIISYKNGGAEIKTSGFYYSGRTGTISGNVRHLIKTLIDSIKILNASYELVDYGTYYDEGVTIEFANRLSSMFNDDNFPEYYEDNDLMKVARVSRSSFMSGGDLYLINRNRNRHGTVVLYKKVTSAVDIIAEGGDRSSSIKQSLYDQSSPDGIHRLFDMPCVVIFDDVYSSKAVVVTWSSEDGKVFSCDYDLFAKKIVIRDQVDGSYAGVDITTVGDKSFCIGGATCDNSEPNTFSFSIDGSVVSIDTITRTSRVDGNIVSPSFLALIAKGQVS